jgi:mono/diheme cytochrome c family protein
MRAFVVMMLASSALAAPAAFADPGPDAAAGEGVFQARCHMCHGTGMGGAPLMEKLSTLAEPAIIEKMTSGTMAPMSAGISDADKASIAAFIVGKKAK